jgi:PKD repeat protein
MIRNAFANRLSLLAGIAMSVAGLSALDAGAQGKVKLNGGTGAECTYSSITIDPAGNLAVTCNTGTGVPVCSINGPTSAAPSAAVTLTASCNPAATSYAWTASSGATVSGAQNATATVGATAGNYTFTVTGTNAIGPGQSSGGHVVNVTVQAPPTGKPVCTFASNPATPAPGAAATITQTCTNSPNAYAWYQYEGTALGLATQTTTGSHTVTFPSAGNYSFWLQAGNDQFGGGDVYSGTVTVKAPGPAPGSCGAVPAGARGPSAGYETLGNLRFDLKATETGYAPFRYPMDGLSGIRITAVGATASETPAGMVATVAVAECPGKFDVPAGCSFEAYPAGAYTIVGTHRWSQCALDPSKQYYVNIKQACTPGIYGYCTNYVKLTGTD